MTTAKWMDDNTTTLQNETPFNHLPTLLHLLSNSSTTHQPQSTPKQPTPQQSVAQSKSPAYDSKGAAYYICSVIVVYALAITLLVASLTKRKRKDQYQAANQHSTSEDYYVNIQKDWTLESSSNSRKVVEGVHRSSTSGSAALNYLCASPDLKQNNNTHNNIHNKMMVCRSNNRLPQPFQVVPPTKANSLDSILKDSFNTCPPHRKKALDAKEESITLLQVLPGLYPPTGASSTEHNISPLSNKRSCSKCRWSISEDGNIVIVQISDSPNDVKRLSDSSYTSKRLKKKNDQAAFSAPKPPATKLPAPKLPSTKLPATISGILDTKNCADNNAADTTACHNDSRVEHCKTSKLKSSSSKLRHQLHQNGHLQNQDKAKNGYHKLNISRLCETYDASPTKLRLTKHCDHQPLSKPLLNIENLHSRGQLPPVSNTMGRRVNKKQDSIEKLRICDFTPTRASLQKLIHVTSV